MRSTFGARRRYTDGVRADSMASISPVCSIAGQRRAFRDRLEIETGMRNRHPLLAAGCSWPPVRHLMSVGLTPYSSCSMPRSQSAAVI